LSIFNSAENSGWTAATKLGEMLQIAEESYGPRNLDYTLLGVEIAKEVNPSIWFPGYDEGLRNITIRISENCENDFNKAMFQISHEVIHCLDPIVTTYEGGSNNIEEGLATYFSIEYCQKYNHGDWSQRLGSNYAEAERLVRQLLSIDNEIISKIRKDSKRLFDITAAHLIQANSTIPKDLATKLSEKFPY
jgi:uncharacterized protein YjaZ